VETLGADSAAVCFQGEGSKKNIHQALRHGRARVVPAALWARDFVQRTRALFNCILLVEFGIPFRVFSHSGTWHLAPAMLFSSLIW
jgi:hypothetical protein